MDGEPQCDRPRCTRVADYRVTVPGAEPALRCRWHADELWRPQRQTAQVERLHREVPEIDLSRSARATLAPALIALACIAIVAIGFAVIAPILF
jgi:hypothetical protein